jgi:hypothetical protein
MDVGLQMSVSQVRGNFSDHHLHKSTWIPEAPLRTTPLNKYCLFLSCTSNEVYPSSDTFQVENTGFYLLEEGCCCFCCVPVLPVVLFLNRNFVEEKLGAKYVERTRLDLGKAFEESSPSTPVFFILSPGVDALKDLEVLGE